MESFHLHHYLAWMFLFLLNQTPSPHYMHPPCIAPCLYTRLGSLLILKTCSCIIKWNVCKHYASLFFFFFFLQRESIEVAWGRYTSLCYSVNPSVHWSINHFSYHNFLLPCTYCTWGGSVHCVFLDLLLFDQKLEFILEGFVQNLQKRFSYITS